VPPVPPPLNFSSWQRSSIYDLVPDAPSIVDGRLVGALDLSLTDTTNPADSATESALFHLKAPRDIATLEPGSILRMAPAPGTFEAETTKMVHIDLTGASLPWQYTPAKANGTTLHPWMVLLVGTAADIAVDAEHGVAMVDSAFLATFNQSDSHRWAHVHDDGTKVQDGMGAPISRLMCTRKDPRAGDGDVLAENTDYVAVIVTNYTDSGQLAWPAPKAPGEPVTLRALHSWTFRTGEKGDFETLAKAIVPRPVGRLGVADLRYERGAVSAKLTVRGAITSLAEDPATDAVAAVQTDLAEYVDEVEALAATDPLGRKVVGMPAYGAPWVADRHAAKWAGELNDDPRHRGTTGIGVWIGREAQDDLVAAVTAQLGALGLAGHLVRSLALGLIAAQSLWNRRLPASPEQRLDVLGPLMRRLATVEGTAMDAVTGGDSPVDAALLSTAARRAVRRGTALTRYSKGPVNRGELVAAVNRCLAPVTWVSGLPHVDAVAAAGGFPPASHHAVLGLPEALPAAVRAAIAELVGVRFDPGALDRVDPLTDAIKESVGPCSRHLVYLRDDFNKHGSRPLPREVLVAAARRCVASSDWDPPHPPEGLEVNVTDVRDFILDRLPETFPPRCSAPDIGHITTVIANALDPGNADAPARLRIQARINIDIGDLRPPELPIGLDYPTWILLRERANQWLLPGIGSLEKNSIVAMQTNPTFIDTYLVGLNSQLHNELHWRNIPVDRMSTPLLMFWGHFNYTTAQRDPEIQPILTWPADSSLGGLPHQVTHPGDTTGANDLVIVFRTDLFRRYPKTLVYLVRKQGSEAADDAALKAVPTLAPDPPVDRDSRTYIGPNLQGAIDRDIAFFSFDINPATVDQYWLVLDEPAAQLRFRRWDVEPGENGNPPTFTELGGNANSSAAFAAATIDRPTRVAFDGDHLEKLGLTDTREPTP
jgi:hypothetical protein